MSSELNGDSRKALPNPVTNIFPKIGQGRLLISENRVDKKCKWYTHVTATVDGSNKVNHFHVSIFDDENKKVGKISWNFSDKTDSYEPVAYDDDNTWFDPAAQTNYEYWMYSKADEHAGKFRKDFGESRIKISMPAAVDQAKIAAQNARQAAYLAQQAAASAASGAASSTPTTTK